MRSVRTQQHGFTAVVLKRMNRSDHTSPHAVRLLPEESGSRLIGA